MAEFTIHTEESAPEGSKPVIEQVKGAFGMLPNLMATFAESPAAIEGYLTLMGIFSSKTDFSPTEQQVVLMTNNRLNGCTYCMAAHTGIAKSSGVPDDVIESLRSGTAIEDPKLDALRVFTEQVFHTRGNVSDADVDAFLAAGYTKGNVLEVVVGTALKVMSNYTNHIAGTPVDKPFSAFAWSPDQAVTA